MLKQKTQYGILSIIIIALLGFVLPSFWKYQAKQLGVNPNYFHIGNNLVDFANLTTYSLLLFGIIGAVISYIVSIIIRNKLIEKIIELQNPTCVGLDTDFNYLPEEMKKDISTDIASECLS